MKQVLQFIDDNQVLLIIVGSLVLAVILFFMIKWWLRKRLINQVYLCVDYFIRNCHSLEFFTPPHSTFSEYAPFRKKLNRKKSAWYFTNSDKTYIENFCSWYDDADSFICKVSVFMPDHHYFSHSEFLTCVEGLNLEDTTKKFLTYDFLSYINKKVPDSYTSIKRYENELKRGFSDIPQAHNASFIQEELERNKSYFDSVLKYPLDQQQRESIVKLEDNCLVISSAGSGKTSTSVAKIKYLVEKRNVSPNKILPLTYTKKAAEELSERLALSAQGLSCHTFHSLAFEILAETKNERPTICDNNLMLICFYRLIDSNPNFLRAVNLFLTQKSSLTKTEHEYSNPIIYSQDREIYGIQAPFKDMDGNIIFTRSEEEKRICTFLSMNNISFRYEQPYMYNTATQFRRQYKPDFTIYFERGGRTYFIILEHFGIDAQGNVPRWFGVGRDGGYEEANRKYHEGIIWKRETNRRYNIAMIETTSAMFLDGTIYQKLEEKLKQFDIKLRPLTEEEKFDKLVRRNKTMEQVILQLITSFITLMKSNRTTFEKILETIKKDPHKRPDFIERSRFLLFDIFQPIYNEYQKALEENKQIDYTDLILKATDVCEQGLYKREYDIILVDEFQDISVDRFRFIQSLRCKQPLTKLYCVGDDWQSIFRFSGSDLSLFSSFEDYFGFTEKCKIEHTYRFGEPLIKISSRFILKNDKQVFKLIQSSDSSKQTLISLVEFNKEEGSQLAYLIDTISNIKAEESIMLVGRYHSDIDFIPTANIVERNQNNHVSKVKINGRELPFNTVHSSKGLEADNIILVNCSQEGNGFPSTISDDPILGYVLSKPEDYPFAEERRLFYVAITRARKHAYILYKQTCPSPFVVEIMDYLGIAHDHNNMICPWCRKGTLRQTAEGINQNGTPWRLYHCSNIVAGCQYSWVVTSRNEENIIRQFNAIVRRTTFSLPMNNRIQAIASPGPLPINPPPTQSCDNNKEENDELPF